MIRSCYLRSGIPQVIHYQDTICTFNKFPLKTNNVKLTSRTSIHKTTNSSYRNLYSKRCSTRGLLEIFPCAPYYGTYPIYVRTLATTVDTSSQSKYPSVHQWTQRTNKFLQICEKDLIFGHLNVPSQLQPTTYYDSRWWNEVEEIVRFWSSFRPITTDSLKICFQLVFEIAIPKYQRLMKTSSASTQKQNNHNQNEDQSQQENEVTANLKTHVRNLLNIALDLMRISYDRKVSIKIKNESILLYYNTSEMWDELQRLGDLPDVRSFTLFLSTVAIESSFPEDMTSLPEANRKPMVDPLTVLKYMEQLKNIDQKPNNHTWRAAVTVWANRSRYNLKNHLDAPNRAEEILSFMESQSYKPNQDIIANVISTWANADPEKEKDFTEAAHRIFDRYYTDICSTCHNCHFHLIRAYCNSNTLNGAEVANTILQKMINNYIRYSKQQQKQKSVDDATTILDAPGQMDAPPKPELETFCLIMNTYAIHGADPEKIISLLRQIQYIEGILDKRLQSEKSIQFAKTIIVRTVVSIMGKYAKQKCPEYAERILRGIFDAHADYTSALKEDPVNGHSNRISLLAPTTQLVTVAINAWAESRRDYAPEKAESILHSYLFSKDSFLTPDMISVAAVMGAWARSHRKESPDRCEALLRLMWQEYDRFDQLATTESDLIQCNENGGFFKDNQLKVFRREDITDTESYKKSIRPNVVTYATILNAWYERIGNKRTLERVVAVYHDMLKRQIKPNKVVCHILMMILNKVVNQKFIFKSDKEYRQHLEIAAKTSSMILHDMKEKHSLQPDVLSHVMCAKLWLTLCNTNSQIDDDVYAYEHAKSVLQELVLSLQKTNSNNIQTSSGNLRRNDRSNRISTVLVTNDEIVKCTDILILFLQTLRKCSRSPNINLSKELSNIEFIVEYIGIRYGTIDQELEKLRSLAATNTKDDQ